MLTHSSGICSVEYCVSRCLACSLDHLAAVSYSSAVDMRVCADPRSAPAFAWAQPPAEDHAGAVPPLLFIETRLLEFLSLAICHWRASFREFERIWQAFFGQPISHPGLAAVPCLDVLACAVPSPAYARPSLCCRYCVVSLCANVQGCSAAAACFAAKVVLA